MFLREPLTGDAGHFCSLRPFDVSKAKICEKMGLFRSVKGRGTEEEEEKKRHSKCKNGESEKIIMMHLLHSLHLLSEQNSGRHLGVIT